MSFRSLQHIRNRRSTCRGLSQPARFRLQGLATLLTACSLQSRAGFVSHRQRSWDSPFGAFSSQEEPGLLPPSDPTYRFTCRCSRRRSEGPAQQASVPGIQPPESPWRPGKGLARRPLDAPLGFVLPGCPAARLARDFARAPLTRFRKPAITHRPAGAPEFRSARDSPDPRSRPKAPPTDQATLVGFLHRLDSVTCGPKHPRAMCSPHIAARITAGLPMLFGGTSLALPEPPESAEVPSFFAISLISQASANEILRDDPP
jgi:hypothetical protein